VIGFCLDIVGRLREDENAFHKKRGKGESENFAIWSFGFGESADLEIVRDRDAKGLGDRSHAFLDIVDQYDHRDIPNYSRIDWKWMERRFGASLQANIDFFRKGVGVIAKGGFSSVRGVSARIVADAPVPLADDEIHQEIAALDRLSVRQAVPLAYVGSPGQRLAGAAAALDVEGALGGRVLSSF
jgi:hypothetical protein